MGHLPRVSIRPAGEGLSHGGRLELSAVRTRDHQIEDILDVFYPVVSYQTAIPVAVHQQCPHPERLRGDEAV